MKPIKELVYDLEILRAIPQKDVPREDGIEYCAGWNDHANMGIAVVCAYDVANRQNLVYTAAELDKFQQVIDASERVIGFNNLRFDNTVLRLNGVNVPAVKTCDLLRLIWQVKGLNPDAFNPSTHGGYSLDAMAYANFQQGKIGNGALAPVWWQRGLHGAVITYCLHDVYLTWQLYERAKAGVALIDPKDPIRQAIVLPLHSPYET